MATGWVFDEAYLTHDTGSGHPERADRLRAINKALEDEGLIEQLTPIQAVAVDTQILHCVHDPRYVQSVGRACEGGKSWLDSADTPIVSVSYDVARLAVGGVLAACEAMMAGRITNAFCAVRPPGHHAEYDRAMGFCLFNNIAVAAEQLLKRHGLKRVAIVDFDVHHGNGTQHAFESRSDVLFISLHEHPAYLFPGTGFETETGIREGEGFTLNLPMMPGAGDEAYKAAFEKSVMPMLAKFQPDALLVSAGFDAAVEDPLANIELTTEAFKWMAQQLKAFADEYCSGRLISVLEGGYDLAAISRAVAAYVRVLLEP